MSEADSFMLLTGLYLRQNVDGCSLLESSLSGKRVVLSSRVNTDILWPYCELHVSGSTVRLPVNRSALNTHRQSLNLQLSSTTEIIRGFMDELILMFFKLSP